MCLPCAVHVFPPRWQTAIYQRVATCPGFFRSFRRVANPTNHERITRRISPDSENLNDIDWTAVANADVWKIFAHSWVTRTTFLQALLVAGENQSPRLAGSRRISFTAD